MLASLIPTVLGFIFPAIINFIKQKFLTPKSETPAATLSALATTKPETMSQYIMAQCSWLDALVRYFNRDMTGDVSLWVRNLRGAIRPVFVVFSILFMLLTPIFGWHIDPFIKTNIGICLGSWFGFKAFKC